MIGQRTRIVKSMAVGLGVALMSLALALTVVAPPPAHGAADAAPPAAVLAQAAPPNAANRSATIMRAENAAPPAAPAAAAESAHDFTADDYYVHVPAGVKDYAPVLVALHGMGGDGPGACDGVRAWADQEGWILVGPTFAYGDWTSPDQVAREEPRFLPRLAQILDELPDRVGHPVQPQVVLYGFSRGAQLAERFTLLYPERVKATVVMSAGTYTLPLTETRVNGETQTLKYPFGIADSEARFGRGVDLDAVRRVPFWVAVGSEDNDPAAVPAQWSPILGATRVERARRFAETLRGLGITVQETEFPGLGHDIGVAEHDQALAWVNSFR
jgi:predicted esterase